MFWLYRIIFWPLFLLLLPHYLLKQYKRTGSINIGHRFGSINPPPKDPQKRRVWVQAVSVGELNAIGPMLEKLLADPKLEICLSVTSSTGYDLAQKRYAQRAHFIFSFPIDLFCGKVFKRLNPDYGILTEGDLWPEYLFTAKRLNIPVYLINARISDRSYRRFEKIRGFFAKLVSKIHLILAATKQDADRFINLGANPEFVTITGSLKFDTTLVTPLEQEQRQQLLESLGWDSQKKIILGSSTWEGEEKALIEAFEKIDNPQWRLLIVPRHAERGDQIEAQIKNKSYHRRSKGPSCEDKKIVLADTTGELSKLVQLAQIVFIGKSLPPHTTGQTPIEAAAAGKAILMGPGMSNFALISASLVHNAGALWVKDPDELTSKIKDLIDHPQKQEQIAKAANKWFKDNQGATQKTIDWFEFLTPQNNDVRTSI